MRRTIAAAVAVAGLLAACTGGVDEAAPEAPGPLDLTAVTAEPGPAPPSEVRPPRGSGSVTVGMAVARTGTWQVGEAGTVAFGVTDGRLELEDYTPAAGWTAVVDEVHDDEIEIDFTRDDVRWEFEAEIDGARLEIELSWQDRDTPDGAVVLPDAGTATIAADGDTVRVTALDLTEGWSVVGRADDPRLVEITLANGARTLTIDVERRNRRTEVEVEYRVVGERPD